jgi:hypothetical protein
MRGFHGSRTTAADDEIAFLGEPFGHARHVLVRGRRAGEPVAAHEPGKLRRRVLT